MAGLDESPDIVAIALKPQHRHVAITAVARELCGFNWANLNALPRSEQ